MGPGKSGRTRLPRWGAAPHTSAGRSQRRRTRCRVEIFGILQSSMQTLESSVQALTNHIELSSASVGSIVHGGLEERFRVVGERMQNIEMSLSSKMIQSQNVEDALEKVAEGARTRTEQLVAQVPDGGWMSSSGSAVVSSTQENNGCRNMVILL